MDQVSDKVKERIHKKYPQKLVLIDVKNQFAPYLILQNHIDKERQIYSDLQNGGKKRKINVQQDDPKAEEESSYFFYIVLGVIAVCVIGMVMLKLSEISFEWQEKYTVVDYYKILGVEKGSKATLREIKKGYRQAVKTWHPDRNPDCGEECVKQMSEINEAYAVLMNAETKAFHDKHGTRIPGSMLNLAKEKMGQL